MNQRTGINWNSIVTNAVSTLVAAVFVGAALIVWKSATTIDQQVEDATDNIKREQEKLRNTQIELEAARKSLQEKLASVEARMEVLNGQLDSHDAAIEKLATSSSGEPVAPPRPPPSKAALEELEKRKLQEITDAYDTRRLQLQQQLPASR